MSIVKSQSPSFSDQGLVLRTQDLGETDRIIVLLSPERGLIHAVARGIRKSSSRFGGRLQPFMLVDLSLAGGKSLYTVTQVQTKTPFTASLMSHFEAYSTALLLAELSEALLKYEVDRVSDFFDLLVAALTELTRAQVLPSHVFNAFALRSMMLAGWEFSVTTCAVCSRKTVGGWFSREHGLVCSACAQKGQWQVSSRIDPQLQYYLWLVRAGRFQQLASQPHAVETARKAFLVLTQFAQWQLERPLKSLSLFEKEI